MDINHMELMFIAEPLNTLPTPVCTALGPFDGNATAARDHEFGCFNEGNPKSFGNLLMLKNLGANARFVFIDILPG